MVSVTFTADCAITPELIGDLRFRISEEGLLTGRVSFTDVEDPPQALPDTCKLILYGRSTVTENGEVRKGPIHEIFNERFPDLSREMRFRAQLPLVERLEDGTRPVLHLIAALESCDPQSARQLSNVFARLMTCGNTDERISRDEWFERLPAALGITRCELVPSDASLECTEIKAAKRHRLKRKQKKKKKTAIVIPRIRRSFRYHTR